MGVMNRRVLVLNRFWHAICSTTVRRAVILASNEYDNGEPKARIIDQNFQAFTWADWAAMQPDDGEDGIKCYNRLLRIPKVIVLSRYEKLPIQRLQFSRHALYKRDNHQCQYCGCRPGTESLSVDHILPKSRGGHSSWENCVIACVECNKRKRDRTPAESGMKLLKKPVKPKLLFFPDDIRDESWSAFVSDVYWHVPLDTSD